MTIPFYSQDELDARIRKERLWIAAYLRASWLDEYGWIDEEAERIATGNYPRPLMVTPPEEDP